MANPVNRGFCILDAGAKERKREARGGQSPRSSPNSKAERWRTPDD